MKKGRIFLRVVFAISMLLNIVFVVNYHNAKTSFFSIAHNQLLGINHLLNNIVNSIPDDKTMEHYYWQQMELYSYRLDDAMRGLESLQRRNLEDHVSFIGLYHSARMSVKQNTDDYGTAIEELIQYKKKIEQLIEQLSIKESISYNKKIDVVYTPSYALSTKQILNITKDVFRNSSESEFMEELNLSE